MQDLNDFRLFVEVVDQKGFAAAARRLGVPRSRLSRRIGMLEDSLGVRLVHRSTRSFAITEIGREFYRHCVAMTVQAEAAEEVIHRMRAKPRGLVRVSCLSSLISFQIGEMMARFMETCPDVEVILESTNRLVDVIHEGFDLAIRVHFPPLDDSDLVIRKLADSPHRLVASPRVIKRKSQPLTPADLSRLPSLAFNIGAANMAAEYEWRLDGPDGAAVTIRHTPRFITQDMVALRLATLRGIGVCQLPHFIVADDVRSGRLIDLLPEWSPKSAIVHVAFPSKRGLLPSVRALIEFLGKEYRTLGEAELMARCVGAADSRLP
jgi:DNA-binding transcriptional LysR family regulator